MNDYSFNEIMKAIHDGIDKVHLKLIERYPDDLTIVTNILNSARIAVTNSISDLANKKYLKEE